MEVCGVYLRNLQLGDIQWYITLLNKGKTCTAELLMLLSLLLSAKLL